MGQFKTCMVLLARGGSKGIIKKNLQELDDIPLVRRTTEVALESKIFDDLIVSSDDPEILAAIDCLPVKQHVRSEATSADAARSEDALLEIFNDNQINSGHCFLLQCTTPFITKFDLRKVYEIILNCPQHSVVSGYLESIHHWIYDDVNGDVKPITDDMIARGPRQSSSRLFVENGGIYAFPVAEFLKSNSRFCETTIPYVMSKHRSIDIDTLVDFEFAQIILPKLHRFDGLDKNNATSG